MVTAWQWEPIANCPATGAKESGCPATAAKDGDCPAMGADCPATGAEGSGGPATAAKDGDCRGSNICGLREIRKNVWFVKEAERGELCE